MSGTKRQAALRLSGANRAKRGVKLSKPIRDRVACRDESPEIRSVRKGRIRLGSVAPLLSRRAKALAMKTHYSHYSDDEDSDDSCTGDGEEKDEDDEEKDNDEEFYDYDQNHRSYNHRRTPSYHVKCMKDYEEDYDDELVSSTSKHNRTQVKKKKKLSKTRKATTATPTISNRTKSLTNGKAKKITARCNSKKTKAVHNEKTIPSGPITRSRRAMMMTMNDY